MISSFTKIGLTTLAVATLAVVTVVNTEDVPTEPAPVLICGGGRFKVVDGDTEYCTWSFDNGYFAGDVISIPDDATYARISLSREGWIDKGAGVNVATVTVDLTIDDKTLKPYCIFTVDGGDRIGPVSYGLCPLPPWGKSRSIRVNIDSTEDLQSKVSVEFSSTTQVQLQ